jgi:hypothetical protein
MVTSYNQLQVDTIYQLGNGSYLKRHTVMRLNHQSPRYKTPTYELY